MNRRVCQPPLTCFRQPVSSLETPSSQGLPSRVQKCKAYDAQAWAQTFFQRGASARDTDKTRGMTSIWRVTGAGALMFYVLGQDGKCFPNSSRADSFCRQSKPKSENAGETVPCHKCSSMILECSYRVRTHHIGDSQPGCSEFILLKIQCHHTLR